MQSPPRCFHLDCSDSPWHASRKATCWAETEYHSIVRWMPSRTDVRALQPSCSLARDGSARQTLVVSHSRLGIVENGGEKSSLNKSRAMPAISPMLVDLPVPMLKDSP